MCVHKNKNSKKKDCLVNDVPNILGSWAMARSLPNPPKFAHAVWYSKAVQK